MRRVNSVHSATTVNLKKTYPAGPSFDFEDVFATVVIFMIFIFCLYLFADMATRQSEEDKAKRYGYLDVVDYAPFGRVIVEKQYVSLKRITKGGISAAGISISEWAGVEYDGRSRVHNGAQQTPDRKTD